MSSDNLKEYYTENAKLKYILQIFKWNKNILIEIN